MNKLIELLTGKGSYRQAMIIKSKEDIAKRKSTECDNKFIADKPIDKSYLLINRRNYDDFIVLENIDELTVELQEQYVNVGSLGQFQFNNQSIIKALKTCLLCHNNFGRKETPDYLIEKFFNNLLDPVLCIKLRKESEKIQDLWAKEEALTWISQKLPKLTKTEEIKYFTFTAKVNVPQLTEAYLEAIEGSTEDLDTIKNMIIHEAHWVESSGIYIETVTENTTD
jgi:hypothetical protein